MIGINDFLVFLSEYKCLSAYWANFEQSNLADDYHTAGLVISSVFECSPRQWLIRSFHWGSSLEGFDYWDIMNARWDMRCNFLYKNEK